MSESSSGEALQLATRPAVDRFADLDGRDVLGRFGEMPDHFVGGSKGG